MSQIPKEQRLVNSDQVIMDVTSENKSPSLTDIENIISNISDRCEGLVTNGQRDEIINERVLHHMFSWEVGQWFTRHGCGLWDDIILQPEHPTSLKYLKDKINLNDAQETIQHSIGQGTSGNFDFVLNGAPPVCLEWKGPKLFSEKGAVEVLLKLLSEPSESLKIFAGIFTSSTTGKYNHIETAHNRLKNALDFVERVLGIHVNQSSNLYCYLVTIPDSGSRRIHWGNITG
ncbi:hypothetical protein [Gimesia chilikensis]|uniref:hypothetical protein n=1 Tax=Gimesia chilikensis TaxID=2605989 RepID=UPI0016597D63|nr:hypothetical protein [Gimesia chilikensis]